MIGPILLFTALAQAAPSLPSQTPAQPAPITAEQITAKQPWPPSGVYRVGPGVISPEVMKEVVERFARSLVPDGYLFLGHAETLRGLSHDFTLCHTHETFYYQKRVSTPAFVAPSLPDPEPLPAPST